MKEGMGGERGLKGGTAFPRGRGAGQVKEVNHFDETGAVWPGARDIKTRVNTRGKARYLISSRDSMHYRAKTTRAGS